MILNLLNTLFVKRNIIQQWQGNAPKNNQKLAFFSHFDKNNKIAPYVIYYLESLRRQGFDIVFISTCNHFEEMELNKIKPICESIICRKNIGLDFGSWKVGMYLYKHKLANYKTLVFANDSCFAPLFDWEQMFETFSLKENTLCGVTFSTEKHRKPHLQSYFLWLNRSQKTTTQIQSFFNKVRFLKNKRKIIKYYEVGLTQWALKNQLGVYSWVNTAYLKEKGIVDTNVTITHPSILMEEELSPFVKKALFSDKQHAKIKNQILEHIEKTNKELYAHIKNY